MHPPLSSSHHYTWHCQRKSWWNPVGRHGTPPDAQLHLTTCHNFKQEEKCAESCDKFKSKGFPGANPCDIYKYKYTPPACPPVTPPASSQLYRRTMLGWGTQKTKKNIQMMKKTDTIEMRGDCGQLYIRAGAPHLPAFHYRVFSSVIDFSCFRLVHLQTWGERSDCDAPTQLGSYLHWKEEKSEC